MTRELTQTVDKIRRLAQAQELTVVAETVLPHGVQLKLSDGNGAVSLNIYHGKKGISLVVAGSPTIAVYSRVQALRAQVFGRQPAVSVPAEEQPVAGDDIAFGLTGIAGFDYRWIGTDESGKGDYFGPLVAAGMYVDAAAAAELAALGVSDSKTLSDKANIRLAAEIRQRFPERFEIVEIPPERYNTLYEQMTREGKNLNSLLAWGHVRVLENLLTRCPCDFALTDKFADQHYVEQRLFTRGRHITLVQRPRAERNIAVAAASILARERFLTSLSKLSDVYGVRLPKGAAPPVVMAARQLVAKSGCQALRQVAKLHFKTTAKLRTTN